MTLRGRRHDKRVEWRRRLVRAIDMVAVGESTQKKIGKELLIDLIDSDLGNQAERDLASRVSRRLLEDSDDEPMHNGHQEES